MRVAEGVVDRHQLHAGVGTRASSARVNERPIRPNPLMPTRTAIAPSLGSIVAADYSRAWSAFAKSYRIVGKPVGGGRSLAATGSTPRARICPSSAASTPSVSYRKRVDPGAVLSTARRWSVASSPSVSGSCGRRLATWTTWPGVAPTAARSSCDAEHRQQARVERAGGEHDLVGLVDRGDRVRRRGGIGAGRARPGGCRRLFCHRDLALDVLDAVDVGLQHDRLGRGGQDPAHRAEQPAGLVERGR